jgi:Big-like domain-containing protein/parallel beta helix pectate lyase-like protein
MSVFTVGNGEEYMTIAAAVAAAKDGDTVQVQAGTYVNDYPTGPITKSITLEGVGGMVKMVSTGLIPNDKGILVINSRYSNADVTISNFEFSGAAVADHNGAGIRYQGDNLTLNNCYFHDNQEGLLAAASPTGTITINNSEFAHNGYGDTQTHNLYVNQIASLTINNSYFHDVNGQGSEVKSRALNTTITNSRIDDLNATSSYSIDIPNGGRTVIQNNVIEQGPFSANPAIIAFGYGKQGLNPHTSLLISGNTILNDETVGSARGVINYTPTTAQITGNSFYGLTPSQIASGPNTQSDNQFLTTELSLDTTHLETFPITQIQIPISIGLASDTGSPSIDLITSNPVVKGIGEANTLVTIKDGSTTLGTTMADITGAWSFTPTGLANGAHALTATETDLAGNTGSALLNFTLDTHSLTGVA